MKKIAIILSSLLVVLTFAVSGFSKTPQARKLAQAGATEKEIGSVKAFERTYELSFEACQQNTKLKEPPKKNAANKFECNVTIFSQTGEENDLSNSLWDEDTEIVIKKDKYDDDVTVRLNSSSSGFNIYVYWSPERVTLSKEEFLAGAKQLINKFQKVSAKLIKVVH